MRTSLVWIATVVLVAVVASPGGASPSADEADAALAVDAITEVDLLVHLEALQAAADAHGGNRALGTPGYEASVDHVAERLHDAGLEPQRLDFELTDVPVAQSPPLLERIAPTGRVYVESADYLQPEPGALVSVEGDLALVGDGCEDADWDGIPSGAVVLASLSDLCGPAEVLAKAWQRVSGVLLAPEGGTGEPPSHVDLATLPVFYELPTVTVSGDVADELTTLAGTDTVSLRVDPGFGLGSVASTNLVADLPGWSDEVVVVGAHLDSVPEGPGIDDNGSGVAGVLAIAEALAAAGVAPDRTIRFAFWGAEEAGLVGSKAYVGSLAPPERDQIVAYLNAESIGAPNWIRSVCDPDLATDDAPVVPGAAEITAMLRSYFHERDLPTVPGACGLLSDDGSFAAAGIATGGLGTLGFGIKSQEEAAIFGGTADAPTDPCYHRPCDDLTNVDVGIATEMTRALGTVAVELAGTGEAPATGATFVAPRALPAAPVGSAPSFTG